MSFTTMFGLRFRKILDSRVHFWRKQLTQKHQKILNPQCFYW